jgi:hypothetical protein
VTAVSLLLALLLTARADDSSRNVIGILDAVPSADSASWADGVKPVLVAAYDRDRSGAIDTTAELDALPCDVWTAVDRGVHRHWDFGVWVIYGFGEGYGWVGDALGFDEAVRVPAAAALEACGLGSTDSHPRTPNPSAPGAPSTVADDATEADFDDATKTRLLADFDRDGSGALEKKEALAISCDVLAGIDAGVQSQHGGVHLLHTYGFAKGYIWVGYALGFDARARKPMAKRLVQCGLTD